MPWFPRLISSLSAASPWKQHIRTTFILKRRHEVPLAKVEGAPRKLRSRHRIYDFIEFTETRPPGNISVILLNYVEGIGLKGDEISVKKNVARNKLLLPGLAVYATEENRKKYKLDQETLDEVEKRLHSSKTAAQTMRYLSKSIVLVTMNLEHPWTIEPWHVKIALRKAAVIVPDYAITLPSTPISGPNLDLEGKCFLVTITINGMEKVLVRCRIHHWHSSVAKRPPMVRGYWDAPLEPIFIEDAETLQTLPTPPGPRLDHT